jgi:hypothetical protein
MTCTVGVDGCIGERSCGSGPKAESRPSSLRGGLRFPEWEHATFPLVPRRVTEYGVGAARSAAEVRRGLDRGGRQKAAGRYGYACRFSGITETLADRRLLQ